MFFYVKNIHIYMYRRFLPGLCLAVSSTTLGFQLLVVYPTQYKIHKELCEIKDNLKNIQKIEYLGKTK